MNTIIDLYNKLLVYNKNNISFIIDKSNIIWFRLADITNILKYKSRKDVIRDMIDKKYRKSLRNIL
jgi:prophage antirepressor-like protein